MAPQRSFGRRTYRVELAYDGAAFSGFRQQAGRTTVEGALLAALDAFVPGIGSVAVGARTDRGVHATGQVISFYARGTLPLADVADAIDGAHASLAVRDIRIVDNTFHASFSARSRHYLYRLTEADPRIPDPAGAPRPPGTVDAHPLDVQQLDALVSALVGRRCFHAFARQTRPGAGTTRHLFHARVLSDGGGRVRFELAADRFLRRQVRVMVATALREMRCGAPPDALLEFCLRGDRAATAPPAPAGGLYLVGVGY